MQDSVTNNNLNMKEETVDIKKYLWMILRNWFWFMASIIVGLGAAYIINRYSDPIYRVSMTIMIKSDEGSNYGNNNLIDGFNLFQQGKKIENEMAVLKSYDLTRRTIEELDFDISYFGLGRIRERPKYNINEFFVELDTSHYQQPNVPVYIAPKPHGYRVSIEGMEVKKMMNYGEFFENEYLKFRIIPRDSNSVMSTSHEQYYFYVNSVEGLTAQYRRKLSVEKTTEEGSVLMLSSSGPVPQKEIDFLNALASVYIQSGLEDKNIIAENTIEFIDEQLAGIADSLMHTEQNLLNFRLNNDIINIDQEGQALFAQIEELHSKKAQEIVHRKYYKYK
jgi:tyrosine-protein kinase Etk/Wzc